MSLELAYFYGGEAEQYSFYRIPKVLLTDQRYKSVSMEAKVLYGLMLDRMGLSVRNGWLDESYKEAAVRAFVGMAEFKLDEQGLHDIYFKASANGTNNYEKPGDYLTDEGKGSGPFILAYSEMLRLE